ncbi:hypothetical protein GF323_01225 [Candidatus Woesearchaeota archaeon]|nr:hypothetical protein [Candidatus Woesearchaeota archaeon]
MKKSQIHMMETVAVLFIFFLIVAIGLIFYSRIYTSNISDKLEEFGELARVQTVQIASSLPELQCSEGNIVTTNCIDMLKLEYGSSIILSNQEDYFDIFGYANLTVKRIFPASNSGEKSSWQIYDYPKPQYTSKAPMFLPISLYEPIQKNNYFGLMIIEVYR